MRAVVVYESMYGNTHLVADAIGRGLGAHTEVVSVHDADPAVVAGADLLVVGGPTHVHSLTRESTRHAAAEAAAQPDSALSMDPDSYGAGLREWFEQLPAAGPRGRAAAFDTRMPGPAMVTGRASKGIARRLRHHGYEVVAEPESFLVSRENALVDQEIEHATAWGAALAAVVTDEATPTA
jgi:hypothetical protein